jgi:hypothetical protein
MARGGGFLSRIGRALRNVVAPPRQPPRPEPPPKPERGPYRDIWKDHRSKGSYRKNLEVFHNLIDPIESDPDEKLMLWESYVRHMVNGEGRFRRNSTSNMFWRDSGIDPSEMNWARWRDAMGFTGRRRSRTA